MNRPDRQLPLAVHLRDEATLENFLAPPGSQALLLALAEQAQGSEGEAIIYIHGARGSGKTHLLQASCQLAGSGALYLPLAELVEHHPDEIVQGVEALRLVCLDDVDRVLGRADWELALFHLCNRARQRGCRLLVAGHAAPRVLAVDLPDLRSRLGWGIVYQLTAGSDEEKIAILRFRATRRGLALGDEAARYIVARAPRDMDALLGLLDTLDDASLSEQRALSIPFIRGILGW